MDLKTLQGGNLHRLEIFQNNEKCYILVEKLDKFFECYFFNSTKCSDFIKIFWMDLQIVFDEDSPSFGELEFVLISKDQIKLEGDFGLLEIQTDKYIVQEVKFTDSGAKLNPRKT